MTHSSFAGRISNRQVGILSGGAVAALACLFGYPVHTVDIFPFAIGTLPSGSTVCCEAESLTESLYSRTSAALELAYAQLCWDGTVCLIED